MLTITNVIELNFFVSIYFSSIFAFLLKHTVAVAQLVRASDCGSEGRRFEPG